MGNHLLGHPPVCLQAYMLPLCCFGQPTEDKNPSGDELLNLNGSASKGLPSRHGVPGEAGLGHEHLGCSPEGKQCKAFLAVSMSTMPRPS